MKTNIFYKKNVQIIKISISLKHVARNHRGKDFIIIVGKVKGIILSCY